MTVPPRLSNTSQFLYLCLQARWYPGALTQARAMAAAVGWEALKQLAHAGGVAPLLYGILRGSDMLPPDVREDLRGAYYATAARNASLFHELEAVLRQLEAHRTPVILLKGAALAPAIYGNTALRPMGDLDLLVRRDSLPAALAALADCGYRPAQPETHSGAIAAFENECMLRKTGKVDVLLELHWSLLDSPYYQERLPMEWFWRTALPAQIGTAPALMLGPEAQILHLCSHLLLHHGGVDAPRWLWLHDVAEVVAQHGAQIDWELLLTQARSCDLVLPLQRVLPQVAKEWRAPIPATVLDPLTRLRPSRGEGRVFAQLTASQRGVARRFWDDLTSIPGWRKRLEYAWINLFPAPAYMRQRYHIARPLVLPLYYPYRWYLGLRSLLSAMRH